VLAGCLTAGQMQNKMRTHVLALRFEYTNQTSHLYNIILLATWLRQHFKPRIPIVYRPRIATCRISEHWLGKSYCRLYHILLHPSKSFLSVHWLCDLSFLYLNQCHIYFSLYIPFVFSSLLVSLFLPQSSQYCVLKFVTDISLIQNFNPRDTLTL